MPDIANRGRWFRSLLFETLQGLPPLADGRIVTVRAAQQTNVDAKDFPYAYVELTNMIPKYQTTANVAMTLSEQKFFIALGDQSGVTGATASDNLAPLLEDFFSDMESAVEKIFFLDPLAGKIQTFNNGSGNVSVAIHRVRIPNDTEGVVRVVNDDMGVGEIWIAGTIIFSQGITK